MKLIIDIKDLDYKCCKENKVTLNLFEELVSAVSNGTIIDSKTCDNCRNQNSNHGVCDICHEHKCWTAKESECKAENTVSEEIYTQEYLARKDAELKLYKIERILKDIPYGGDATVRRIQEVLEDGDVN